ncbi:hypothetical protein AB5I41_10200 [Sphingomonas sp. MMS24-JH45]
MRSVTALTQRPGDPRRYSRKEIDKAANILRRFGARLPLLVQSDGVVIAVRQRRRRRQKARVRGAPDDHRRRPLSEYECKQLSIALARLYELGKFDRAAARRGAGRPPDQCAGTRLWHHGSRGDRGRSRDRIA